MRMRRHCTGRALALAAVACSLATLDAQPVGRRVATVAALRAYPGFYHLQQVLVRGEVTEPETRPTLLAGDSTIRMIFRDRTPSAGTYDIRGELLDIGRLQPNDPRLAGIDLHRLGIDPNESWPRQGEVLVLRVSTFEPAEPPPAPSIRAIALDPYRYADQHVTVSGQFRGRNLYGDLPQAPAAAADRRNKGEFVLRSADAAVWVLGKQPRGRGFQFDPESRIDTKRWLEVAGTVRHAQGLVWLEAEDLREIEPQKEDVITEVAPPPKPIPPEVVFSVPTQDETDISQASNVRIQFSRDLEPATIKGHVRVSYLGQQSAERGEPQPPSITAQTRYDAGTRVMEISFSEPLERFRTVKVELLEGITGTDGAPLAPWTLTFSVGGS
jgi:hypothetical protein